MQEILSGNGSFALPLRFIVWTARPPFPFSTMRKLILSRKGMDASAGGIPSPIFPDGQLLSLPIPQRGSGTRYEDLVFQPRMSYQALIRQLGSKARGEAHLDPDLIADPISRPAGWQPAFGQTGAALSHLQKEGVGVGDLFLFFGWFREVEKSGQRWRFRPSGWQGHLIYGWLEVGQVIDLQTEVAPDWAQAHPHLSPPFAQPRGGNALFVAAETRQDWPGLPGAGMFSYHPALALTRPGTHRRSEWRLPSACFGQDGHCHLSYHRHKRGQPGPDGHLLITSAPRGQEFVMPWQPGLSAWLASLPTPDGY